MTSNDINNIYLDILKNIKTNGVLRGKVKEVIFLTFSLFDLDKNVLFFPFSQRNWGWILREASDRIFNIKNPGYSYKFSKNWENRIQEDGFYSYHYSDRLSDQMEKLLSKNLMSKDKIVEVWEKSDVNIKGRKPCTIIMQPIMESDKKMSLIVYMRNNDIINIFPSDVFIHSTYFKYWTTKKGIEYKNLYWVAASAYYHKKREANSFIEKLISNWRHDYSSLKVNPTKWNKALIEDLENKESLEKNIDELIENKDLSLILSGFKTDYVREWLATSIYYYIKKNNKSKDKLDYIKSINYKTEFGFIVNGLK